MAKKVSEENSKEVIRAEIKQTYCWQWSRFGVSRAIS
jgi:hypothetical protein